MGGVGLVLRNVSLREGGGAVGSVSRPGLERKQLGSTGFLHLEHRREKGHFLPTSDDQESQLGRGILREHLPSPVSSERLRERTNSQGAEELKKLCGDRLPRDALDVLHLMDQRGIIASIDIYGHLLHCCMVGNSLSDAKRVHAHMVKNRLESNSYLGNLVVNTFVKCGGLDDAIKVLDRLSERTVFSWTAVITGCTKSGKNKEALRLYQRMVNEGVEPNKYTLVRLLKACGSLADLENGKKIHAAAVRTMCESDLFVGTSLVGMYAKCGSMVDARAVFDTLPKHDVVLWNAMLAGYAQQEQGEQAMQLFELMQQEGVRPDNRTLVSVVKACCSLAAEEKPRLVDGQLVKAGCLLKAREIHAEVVRRGYEWDAFIGASLITLFANCGSMLDAGHVFDMLTEHDVVLWTAMIAGCAQQAQGGKALQLYGKMQQEGVRPNNRTFVAALKACGSQTSMEQATLLDGEMIKLGCLQQVKEIHEDVKRSGCASNLFVGNTLIDTYAKCGSMVHAQGVFDSLPRRDEVSWNVMIAGYAQQERGDEALRLFARMENEGLTPNSRTFVSALQSCGSLAVVEEGFIVDGQCVKPSALQKGREIHAEAVRRGLHFDAFVANAIVTMYADCGSMSDAEDVFDTLPLRDVVSWNAMIAGYAAGSAQDEKALHIYARMLVEGLTPDSWTFVSVLKACGSLAAMEQPTLVNGQSMKLGCLEKGKAIHATAVRMGYQSHVFVGNTLVDMYANCGDLLEARLAFDALPERTVVSWTAMISAYAEQGQGEEAMKVFTQMQADGVRPNEATLLCILKACSSVGSLNLCHQIHGDILKTEVKWSDKLITTLIHCYGKCGSMVDARHVFDSFPHRDAFSWTALIAGYSRQGECGLSLQCFEEMLQAGIRPHGVTYLALLAACSHAGMVEKGLEYFESMTRDHQLVPTIEHYVSVIDLLGRAGLFSMVEEFVFNMPMQPNVMVWLCLLGACQKHNNVELGRRAFDCAVKLEPELDAPYVLMSNIYCHAHMLEDAIRVEDMRRQASAWKKPGLSWIEDSTQLTHTFRVEDTSHPQSQQVHAVLRDLTLQMKENGNNAYALNTQILSGSTMHEAAQDSGECQ